MWAVILLNTRALSLISSFTEILGGGRILTEKPSKFRPITAGIGPVWI
jgi:hypothetical protein